MRRLLQQDHRRPDAVGHLPGAARHPHRGLADLEDPRAQDPRHRAGHRRRLRQQGRRLFRLHLRHRRLDRHRAAGEVGRGPDREPDHHGLRPRLLHGDGDRLHQGRQGAGPPLLYRRRPRRLRRLRQCQQMAGRAVLDHLRLLRLPGRVVLGRRRLHQQGAGRRRLSLLVPGDRGGLRDRAGDGHHGPQARHGPGRVPDEEPDPEGAVPLHLGLRLAVRFRRLPDRARRRRSTPPATRRSAPSRRRSRRPSGAARPAS